MIGKMDMTGKITELENIKRVHLMGIGGAGMASLAKLLAGLGYQVSGCDLVRGSSIQELETLGVTCLLGHSHEHIARFDPELLIYSSAIDPNCEELKKAHECGIRTVGRGQALSWLFNAADGVGIAGAHGKTTTSSMIGLVLSRAGLSPTFYIGGQMRDMGTNALLGTGKLFVSELDESDGSFEFFHPALSVITNADWDHVNHFATREDVVKAFTRFVDGRKPNAPLVICAEDDGTQTVLETMTRRDNILRYGWGCSWEWGAFDLKPKLGGGISCRVCHEGHELGELELLVSGEHNVLNALATLAVADTLGVPFENAAATLADFHGAARRLQTKGTRDSVLVIDDYAHHPTEIEATLGAVKSIYPQRRLIVVFQPHRYTRTAAFLEPLAAALSAADSVLLLPIYGAGEDSLPVPLEHVAEKICAAGKTCVLCQDSDAALKILREKNSGGDIILTMGAGDVFRIGEKFLEI